MHTTLKFDCDAIIIPANNKTIRMTYIKPVFSKFDLTVYPCDNQYPYGHEILIEDYKAGRASLRLGPVPTDAQKKTYVLRVVEFYSGATKNIPVTIV